MRVVKDWAVRYGTVHRALAATNETHFLQQRCPFLFWEFENCRRNELLRHFSLTTKRPRMSLSTMANLPVESAVFITVTWANFIQTKVSVAPPLLLSHPVARVDRQLVVSIGGPFFGENPH